MAECCGPDGSESIFSTRFARRMAKRYRTHGLSPVARRIVDFAGDHGITGATVLEIGGGVGELHVELLRRGAASATNLELTANYEQEAARLYQQFGVADRVRRYRIDIAQSPDLVEPADVVVLHRVVCCYPDYQRLLSAAASHARQLLVYSYPAANRMTWLLCWLDNAFRRMRGNPFRAFVHPPDAMIAVAEGEGLGTAYHYQSRVWNVVGLAR